MIAIKKMIKKMVYIACNRIENPNDSKRKKKNNRILLKY